MFLIELSRVSELQTATEKPLFVCVVFGLIFAFNSIKVHIRILSDY